MSVIQTMIELIREGEFAPLSDWLVDHPEDYPEVCQEISILNENLRCMGCVPEWTYRENWTYRDRRRITREVRDELVSNRDRAAQMLGEKS